jgi:hypothetical protein
MSKLRCRRSPGGLLAAQFHGDVWPCSGSVLCGWGSGASASRMVRSGSDGVVGLPDDTGVLCPGQPGGQAPAAELSGVQGADVVRRLLPAQGPPGRRGARAGGPPGALAAAAEVPTVVVYLAASKAIEELPLNLAAAMMSAGRDSADRDACLTGIPVSPLETTSLERVARAVSIALLQPALTAYPAEIRLGDGRVPERLINEILIAVPAQAGHSPLFHRPVDGSLMMRRPLTAAERMKLEGAIRQLTVKTSSPGWERDLTAEINLLGTAIESAADSLTGLLTCPLCQASADTREVDRDGAFFAITCQSCKARWGLDVGGS